MPNMGWLEVCEPIFNGHMFTEKITDILGMTQKTKPTQNLWHKNARQWWGV